jgi:acyl-CoA dehydrogenase
MFADAIEDILRDHCTPTAVRAIESGAEPGALWGRLADAGFLDLLKTESDGGAGLPLSEFFAVLLVIGRYAVPLPLAQAMSIRALAPEGCRLPPGRLSVAPGTKLQDGALVCPLVPHGLQASHVLVAFMGRRYLLDVGSATATSTGTPGHLAATLVWASADKVLGHALDCGADQGQLSAWGGAMHAAMIAGAMERIFDMTLRYCNEREQFGRPLGKYQSVQHQLSVMAQHVVASSIAAQAAFQGSGSSPRLRAAALAKSRASEAAIWVANTAHALHGAIGITADYDLQIYTRRLHEWRTAHGSEHWWNRRLGEFILASDQSLSRFVQAIAQGSTD